jgi:amidophosphoribosyltransferase
MESDVSVKHECGVFGVFNCSEASNITYLGLTALQHRGQEGAGIATSIDEKGHFGLRKSKGLVIDVFSEEDIKSLKGNIAVGHVRYSTTGESNARNLQPFVFEHSMGKMAIVHNGNLINSDKVKKSLIENGSIFASTSDTEIITHLISKSKESNIAARIKDAVKDLKGAYSLILMTENKLFALRDPWGIRPLVLGKIMRDDGSEGYVVSSETSPFHLIGAKYVRDVKPGELVEISQEGIKSEQIYSEEHKFASCIFELIYFARPDSQVFGKSVYNFRYKVGEILAKKAGVEADIVSPVPDSGTVSAMGYAAAAGIPFHHALIRNHYIGRTFIEPQNKIRNLGVKLKLHPVRNLIKGKRIILVDDSLVRGTTSKKVIKEVKSCGAKEVHMMITSPPFKSPCYYGIDTPTKEELIANNMSVEEIRKYLGADSLTYLDVPDLAEASNHKFEFCSACFDGSYVI